jgi:hypothetical protein
VAKKVMDPEIVQTQRKKELEEVIESQLLVTIAVKKDMAPEIVRTLKKKELVEETENLLHATTAEKKVMAQEIVQTPRRKEVGEIESLLLAITVKKKVMALKPAPIQEKRDQKYALNAIKKVTCLVIVLTLVQDLVLEREVEAKREDGEAEEVPEVGETAIVVMSGVEEEVGADGTKRRSLLPEGMTGIRLQPIQLQAEMMVGEDQVDGEVKETKK